MQESTVEKLRDEIKEIKDDVAKRKRKIDDNQREIRNLEKACEKPPPEEASIEFGERSRELRDEINAIKAQIVDMRGQYEQYSQAIDTASDEKKRVLQQ